MRPISVTALVGLALLSFGLSACAADAGVDPSPDVPEENGDAATPPPACVDCAPATCTDKIKNGTETDVDCGGSCGACAVGKACKVSVDCTDKSCAAGTCVAATGTDGILNGTETDVDCGGGAPSNAPKCADGKICKVADDCASLICSSGVCAAPTYDDKVKNGTETDVDCGGGVAPNAPLCADGKTCKVAEDCVSLVCQANACAAPTHDDKVKNGTETDVDCGGAGAPLCAENKACSVGADCDSGFCTDDICEPRKEGRKDGDETDIDCGGAIAPKCDWDKTCAVDADCTSSACGPQGTCLTGPSCKVQNGGRTCGLGGNEDCCRSLPVTGYPKTNGKTVYLDKYEITAGRMRAFVEAVKAANAGVPNVKGYMAAHRPTRWNLAWEAVLPAATGLAPDDENSPDYPEEVNYAIANPTRAYNAADALDPAYALKGYLYPGQDVFQTVGSTEGGAWQDRSGTWTIQPGLAQTFGEYHFFPEYYANPATNPFGDDGYAASHALNCSNYFDAYGWGTYWQSLADLKAISYSPEDVAGKGFTQAKMDTKAANCTTTAMFAAFCAWDGGQLVTQEVMQNVTNGRLGAGGNCTGGINMTADGGHPCDGSDGYAFVWYEDSATTGDDSGRVAPPGRLPNDVIKIDPGDEGWYDLKGNLVEVVVKTDDRFIGMGYGLGYSSVLDHHRTQQLTPRYKSGSFGARCMRLK